MKLRTLDDWKRLRGKRVLLRADFNVPVSRGRVSPEEDWRLRKAAPTVERLCKAGARVVIATHLGRPGGRKSAELKTDPIAKRLAQLAGHPIRKIDDCVGESAQRVVAGLNDGQAVLLENLRFKKGEEADDPAFAQALSELGDVFVNEAFGTCHRAAASITGVTRFLPSYAGPLVISEVEALGKALDAPARPYVVVMGGAKVSDKIGVLTQMLAMADHVLLGGALIAPFFKAQSHCIGATPCSDADLEAARELMNHPFYKKLILPCDVVTAVPDRPKTAKVIDLQDEPFDLCRDREAILDIGPKTISAYAAFIRAANLIVWNGPLGLFEVPKFSHGTLALGRLIAARSQGKAFGIAGGGETSIALHRTGLGDCIDHLSTGGGAMLEFLEGKALPGLEALRINS